MCLWLYRAGTPTKGSDGSLLAESGFAALYISCCMSSAIVRHAGYILQGAGGMCIGELPIVLMDSATATSSDGCALHMTVVDACPLLLTSYTVFELWGASAFQPLRACSLVVGSSCYK